MVDLVSSRASILLGLALLSTILAGGCGTAHSGYQDAMANWRAGHHTSATARAEAEYTRFREANALSEDAVRATVDSIRHQLAETPVVPTRAPAAIKPGGGPGTLSAEMRIDLLSGAITPTVRAAVVVESLGLRRHAYELITIVYRREPFIADGGLLQDASVAMRALAAKRVALDALRSLATTRP
jgi:hypothetical protein